MKKLLTAVQTMDDTNLAQYIFSNMDDYEGVTEGIYVTIEDLKFEVRFDNSDIIDYLKLDENIEGEALIEAYEDHEDEVNLHFLQEQIERIREELKEQLGA